MKRISFRDFFNHPVFKIIGSNVNKDDQQIADNNNTGLELLGKVLKKKMGVDQEF